MSAVTLSIEVGTYERGVGDHAWHATAKYSNGTSETLCQFRRFGATRRAAKENLVREIDTAIRMLSELRQELVLVSESKTVSPSGQHNPS